MDIMNAIILGMIQGLTEFLPISSSAHLVIAEKLLGFEGDGIFLKFYFTVQHCYQ